MKADDLDILSDDDLAARALPFNLTLLAGQRVLVSGGGGGLGRAIAWTCARLGAEVVLTGRNQDKLDHIVGGLNAAGLKAHGMLCNIRKHDEVVALFSTVVERFGQIDLLVNNAGGQFPSPALDISPNGWHAVIETNLTGTWYMMQAAAQQWRAAGRPGSIVNIIAVTDRGMPGVAHTAAARAGVEALGKTVAIEWAEFGIRVNAIAPGAIATEGQRVYSDAARARSARSNPMMRFGDAADIADAVVFVGGASGKFITGETLDIDGGGKLWGEFWVAEDKPDYFK